MACLFQKLGRVAEAVVKKQMTPALKAAGD